jgi:tRNA(fMet)-specific endonuclease VapC
LHAGAHRKLRDFEELTEKSHVWLLDQSASQAAADICADLWQRGEPLDDADIMIAGIALSSGLVLATNNTEHFSRISGLQVENWCG